LHTGFETIVTGAQLADRATVQLRLVLLDRNDSQKVETAFNPAAAAYIE